MAARVVLAMSGGVDSSVAAHLLKEQGHEVIGLFMRTGVVSPVDSAGPAHKKGCCSALDAGDARRVADQLDIPFYALDFEGDFARIIDIFAEEYLAGRTPNPCVLCNSWLKFGKLWSYGQQLGADYIATGHYAQVLPGPEGAELHRAVDQGKDQSYVLFGLRRRILSHLLFPIGGFRKDQVRTMAKERGLAVHDKPDSVEICFVPDGDHARVVRERRPGQSSPGHFVDRAGNVLGSHDGIDRYTVGQRRGLGVALGERRYVLQLVPSEGTVVLGDREDLLAPGLTATKMNWLIEPSDAFRCLVQIRSRHHAAPATVRTVGTGHAEIAFEEPQSAVTPGQAVVLYQDSRVLGGGWIECAWPTLNP